MGCCPLKFLHALEIDLGYLAHPQGARGSPEKKFNYKNLNFGGWPKIQRVGPYKFGANGNILTKQNKFGANRNILTKLFPVT